MLTAIWSAYLIMNVVTFSLYGADKRRARRNKWRIPERTLLACTWLMGGVGAFAAMRVFRHKTRHMRFVVSAPVAAALQLIAMSFASAALMGWIFK